MTQGRRQASSTATREASAEDFLFHMYRGSEFLAEGRFDGAREHFEHALKVQPRDPQAQDLLAKLYFRLGVYPRAIELYLDIVRQLPDQIPPRINLALAFLKTGQMRDAVTHLLPVIERESTHQRAWAYLGLAWSRLGEFAKAREAFSRAGHDGMANRMQAALEQQYGVPSHAAPAPAAASATSTAERAIDAITASSLEQSVRPGPPAPAAPAPSAPAPSSAESEHAESEPSKPAGLLRLERPEAALALRAGALLASAGSAARWTSRCVRVDCTAETLPVFETTSSEEPLLWVTRGWVLLPPERGKTRAVLEVHDPGLLLREPLVLGFDGGLHHRLRALGSAAQGAWIELRGQGHAVLQSAGTLTELALHDHEHGEVPVGLLAGFEDTLHARVDDAGKVHFEGPGRVWLLLGEGLAGT